MERPYSPYFRDGGRWTIPETASVVDTENNTCKMKRASTLLSDPLMAFKQHTGAQETQTARVAEVPRAPSPASLFCWSLRDNDLRVSAFSAMFSSTWDTSRCAPLWPGNHHGQLQDSKKAGNPGPTVAPLPVETWNNRRDLLVRSPLQIESIEDIWRYQEGEKNTPAGRTAKITLRPATSISYHSREGQNPYRHHACHACVPGNQILPLFQRSGFWWSSGSTWRSCLGTVGMVVKSISCWLITLNYHLPDGFTEFRQV